MARSDNSTPKSSAGGDAKVKEIRDWTTYAEGEWQPILDKAEKDMQAAAGDPWDPDERRAREKANRPVLVFDEFQQYINQVVNDFRANPIGVEFSPVSDGASEESARFYADHMREIEYRSNAQIHYTAAAENAVMRSYGFVRVTTRYESDRSVNQQIWIDGFPNPDLVLPDPDALSPDLLDQKRCVIRERFSFEDFKRKFPKATITSFGRDIRRQAPQWIHHDHLFVGECWETRYTQKRLNAVALPVDPNLRPDAPTPEPTGLYDDEIEQLKQAGQWPEGAQILQSRTVDIPEIHQVITNGLEILKETPWLGKYIPIVGCLGRVLYKPASDGGSERVILSMIRLARDPYMLYCYYRSTEAEIVGMTPKFPWFYYQGALDPEEEKKLAKANREPVPAIKVKPRIDGLAPGVPTPYPSRQPYEPPIQAFELGAESARRGIQAAMGWTALPTDAQRINQKSGVALKRIENGGQRGMYHFRDHYQLMVRAVGVVTEDLMDKYLDTPRDVGVRRKDGTSETIRINDPRVKKSVSTKGTHLVTVSTGPAFDSQREEASDFADTLAQIPQLLPILGPLIVKLKNLGPIGDEMVELLEALQPPAVQALKAAKKQGDPAMLASQLAQAQQRLQQLEGIASQMHQALQTDQAKQQGQLQVEALRASFQKWKAELDSETKITVAELGAKIERLDLYMQERARVGLQADAAAQSALDRTHDVNMAAVDHAHTLQQGDQAHGQALEQADQGAAIASGQMQQQAELQPPDAVGGA